MIWLKDPGVGSIGFEAPDSATFTTCWALQFGVPHEVASRRALGVQPIQLEWSSAGGWILRPVFRAQA